MVSSPITSDSDHPLEQDRLCIAYMPTADAIPLLHAHMQGYFLDAGLHVKLHAAPGWNGVKNLLAHGKVDLAHVLAPLPLVCSLGISGAQADICLTAMQSVNGQALTLSRRYADIESAEQMRGLKLAVPSFYSMEYYLLCDYLAGKGIDPLAAVEIVEIDPVCMPHYLSQGWIDGMFAPEPFNQVAVNREDGFLFMLSQELWDGHPGCGIAASRTFLEANPNTHRLLLRVLLQAQEDLQSADANTLSQIAIDLSRPGYLDQEDSLPLEQVLIGHFSDGRSAHARVQERIGFIPCPQQSNAVWLLTQMQRWGQLQQSLDYNALAQRIYPDEYCVNELVRSGAQLSMGKVKLPDVWRPLVEGDSEEEMRHQSYCRFTSKPGELKTYDVNPQLTTHLQRMVDYLATASGGDVQQSLPVMSSGVIGELERLLGEAVQNMQFAQQRLLAENLLLKERLGEQAVAQELSERQLKSLRDEAQAAERVKSRLLEAMSQEIKTPMHGVLGMTQILLDMALGDEQRDYVQIIHQSGKTLLSAINDIQDFSHVQAGQLELESIPFDLERAVYEVAELLQARAREKHLELILLYSPRLPKHFMGDPGRVRQILMNLVGNAIKFTSQGYVLIEVSALQMTGETATVSVRVEDTGIGVDQETKRQLFESFMQEGDAELPVADGRGLGLAICKRLVDLMQGELTLQSEVGEGSAFSFTLPLQLADKPESLPLSDLGGVRIMVIEPSPLYGSVQKDYLASFAMRPVVVTEAEEAIARLRKATKSGNAFQICMVADPMRDFDTAVFAKQVQTDPLIDDLALVVLSAEAQRGDAERFKAAGYTAYLTRPMLRDVFRKTLAAVLASRQLHLPTAPIITKHQVDELANDLDGVKLQLEGHVLLAEDILPNQAIAKAILRKLGLDVSTANNGAEAVKRWKEGGIDLVLMDRHMPETDGIEATRIIRRLEREQKLEVETPIIALSANPMSTDRQSCLDVGMNGFVTKPLVREQLVEVLVNHLPSQQKREDKRWSRSADNSCVDWHALKDLEQLMGEEFVEMIPSFSEVAEAIIGQLAIADGDDDILTVEHLAKSLASASAGVGAVGLLSLARMLELQAQDGRVTALPRQVSELQDAFSKARSVLETYHQSRVSR